MPRTKAYLSGPITLGDRSENLCRFLQAHRILLDRGFAPLNPGLSMLIPWAWDVPHKAWLEADLPWVEVADLVIRMPGLSTGADMEVGHAKKHGIPVLFIENLSDLEKLVGV